MKCTIISFLILSSFLENTILAYPGGAGGCNTGGAVADTHLVNPTTGSLKDGNFQLVTNGNAVISPNRNITAITPESGYQLNILPVSGSGAVFRGVLIRVQGPGTFTLTPKTNAQVAMACPGNGVVGVTHIDRTDKTEFGSGFKTESEGLYKVEVTVVVSNNATSGSVYYYDSFELTSYNDIPDFPTVTPILSNVTFAPTAPVAARVPSAAAPVAASVPSATPPVAATVPTAPTPVNATVPTAAVPTAVSVPTVAVPVAVSAPVADTTNITNAPSMSGGDANVTMSPTMSPSTTRTPSSDTVTEQPSTIESDVPTNGTTLMPTKGMGETSTPVMASVPTPLIAPVTVPTSGSSSIAFLVGALTNMMGAMLFVSLPMI